MNVGVAAAVVVIVAAIVITLGLRGLVRRRDRQSRAGQLERELEAALERDPAMAGWSVHPRVHIGADDRVIIALRGDAPSTWHRYAARRTVAREVRRLGIDAAVTDRITARDRVRQRA